MLVWTRMQRVRDGRLSNGTPDWRPATRSDGSGVGAANRVKFRCQPRSWEDYRWRQLKRYPGYPFQLRKPPDAGGGIGRGPAGRRVRGGSIARAGTRARISRGECQLRLEPFAGHLERRTGVSFLQLERSHLQGPRALDPAVAVLSAERQERLLDAIRPRRRRIERSRRPRASAAGRNRHRARGPGLPWLWRRDARDWRGLLAAARRHPGAVSGDRYSPPEIRLPRLPRGGCAGAGPGPADRGRVADRAAGCPDRRREIRRSLPAVSPGANSPAPRHRH